MLCPLPPHRQGAQPWQGAHQATRRAGYSYSAIQIRDRAQASSAFHLDLTARRLVTVLPLTSVERVGWVHRVRVGTHGWVITEQVRTVSADRFRRYAPEITLSPEQLAEVRHVLAQMLIV
jgi:mRNA interferase MazF